MSVIKAKRGISSTDFFMTMVEIETNIMAFLMRDFNIKRCNRDVKLFVYKTKLTEQEEEALVKILKNHKEINFEVSYPMWLLEHMRDRILKNLEHIRCEVIEANTIYPNSDYEYNKKREHQTSAIAGYYMLLSNLQAAINIFHPKSKEKYMPLIELIEKELKLLKGWKKSTSQTFFNVKVKRKKRKYYQKANEFNPYNIVSVTYRKNKKGVYESEVSIEMGTRDIRRKIPNDLEEYALGNIPIHFVPEEIYTNVSFDKFVEKDTITPIRFVPFASVLQLT